MKLVPHFRFNNNKCIEAIEFYKSCFSGAKVEPMYLKDSPMAKDAPKEDQMKIMHALFTSGDIVFSMSDTMRDMAVVGDQVSIMINCDKKEQAEDVFEKLSKDGEIFMPLEKQFWGAWFGMVTDKYGIEWSINCQIDK